MTEITAIEIVSPKIYEIIQTLEPRYDQPYEDVHLHFLLIGYPQPGKTSIWSPSEIGTEFDHIENGHKITLKQLVK